MALAIFFAGMMVAQILDLQRKRHERGLQEASVHFGMPIPPRRPRLPRLESLLNVGLGLLIGGVSTIYLLTALLFPDKATRFEIIEFSAAAIGTGFAMAWLGLRGLKELKRFEAEKGDPFRV
jgi:hypothetical protein